MLIGVETCSSIDFNKYVLTLSWPVLTNLETGLSSLQANLVNLSSLLASRLGPSLGTETSLPLGTPSYLEGVPVSGIVPTRSHLPVTPVVLPDGTPACMGSQSQSSSQPGFLSLPSFQPNDPGRSSGEQRVYPTEVEVIIENSQVADRPLDVSMEEEGREEQVLSTNFPPPPFRGWNRDPRYLSSEEPGIGGYQVWEKCRCGCRSFPPPPPPYRGLSSGPSLTSSLGFHAPHWGGGGGVGGINYNPHGTGVGRTDHQMGPLEVSVTTGSTTSVVPTVSYHLKSLSSDTVTSFSVPGNRCSGLTPKMYATPMVPVKAPPHLRWVRWKQPWMCYVELGILFLIMRYMIVHWKTQPRSYIIIDSLQFKNPTSLDSRVSLDYLKRDIRYRHPSMLSPLSTCPSKPHSVGISRFFPQGETVNDSLPLSPAISQWLDVQTDISRQGRSGENPAYFIVR